MGDYKVKFNKLNINKISVSFTWDDNNIRHYAYVAKTLEEYGFCGSFYINPGEDDFEIKYLNTYRNIASSRTRHEIGSHGNKHYKFIEITQEESKKEFLESKKKLKTLLSINAYSFAFPYHLFNDDIVNQSKIVYFETRNTLSDSMLVKLKTNFSLCQLKKVSVQAIELKKALVFVGHSIYIDEDDLRLGLLSEELGYKPIDMHTFRCLLEYIQTMKGKMEVITFFESSVKQFIKKNCVYNDEYFIISNENLKYLKTYGITFDILKKMV